MQRDRGSNLCSRNRVRLQVRVEEKHLTEIKTQSYLNQGKRNYCVPFTRQSRNLENRNYPQRLSYRLKKNKVGITLDVCQDFITTRQKSDQRKPLVSHISLPLCFVLSHLEFFFSFLQTLPL